MEGFDVRQIKKFNILWRRMPASFPLVANFEMSEWQKIFSFIHSDKEFHDFCHQNRLVCRNFLLYKACKPNVPIGFCCVIFDNYENRSVMIHGGIWMVGKIDPISLFEGMVGMAVYLMAHKLKVHSQCSIDNHRSFRFLRTCGFTPYRYADGYVKMYLSMRTLQTSKFYQWQKMHWKV